MLASRLIFITLLTTLTACASAPDASQRASADTSVKLSQPQFNTALFEPRNSLVKPQQLFALTAEQQQDFLFDFNGRLASLPEHQRISEYLQDLTYGFNYKEQTYMASEAFALSAGNCMALAILTKGLADLVGVEIKFQRVTNAPVYDRNNDVVMVSDHVRARLYKPEPEAGSESKMFIFQRSWIVVDYFPSKDTRSSGLISNEEFLALYYRNRAAELMMAGQADEAFAYAQEALRYMPKDADTLNIIGLLHRRAGDDQTAEALYQYALQQNPHNLNVLHNYQTLAKRQQRNVLVDELTQRIQAIPDSNPYTWIALAERAFEKGELDTALAMYSKAAESAPYVHEAYWGQARVHAARGDTARAKRVLERGLKEARLSATKGTYKAGWYSYQGMEP
ncbi:tetratricopeptide repeat protein [Pseudidiomarina sp.]|uniref:tetratricopeptide repeat protein n=1 Tax=Pseudidiomarina sp. TaxID=2081707 RepID=UPI003A97ED73